jgi:two-component sensor histidine kinase
VEQWEEEEGMETTLLKKISILDLEGNEENGYLVPDPNKTMINDTKKHSDAHKNTLKEEITEKFKKILDMVIQMYNMHSRKFKTPKIKNMRRHRKK